jgi:hypothetical protein
VPARPREKSPQPCARAFVIRTKCVPRLRQSSLGYAALAVLGAGCLDAGPTPLGRHLVGSRVPEQVQLVDGAVGAPRRILLTRSLPADNMLGFPLEEVSTVDVPGPGASEARVIVSGISGGLHCTSSDCAAPIDSLGRIYWYKPNFVPVPGTSGATTEIDNLVRVDPATGTERDFGVVSSVQLSPDRTRAVFQLQPEAVDPTQPAVSQPLVAVDLDDSMTTLAVDGGQFAGDDFYVLKKGLLSRLPRGKRALEDIATNIHILTVASTTPGPLIILTTFGPMRAETGGVSSLLDPMTLAMETLPTTTAAANGFYPSPSGRYVATIDAPPFDPTGANQNGPTTITLYDRDTGQESVATEPSAFLSNMSWRPGRDEVWFEVSSTDLFRWPVGDQPERVGRAVPDFSFPTLGPPSPQTLQTRGDPIFTPDGQFRFVVEGFQSEREPIDLQSADDAAAAPYLLNQPNMGIAAIWPLGDGNLLVEDFISDTKKNDAYFVDPVARTQHRISSTGNVIATGRDRCLALLDWVATGGSGDLTIVDYATGAQTLVAQNVHSVAVDASSDATDALASGTRVAFLVRNRIESPYDGLWVIDLP